VFCPQKYRRFVCVYIVTFLKLYYLSLFDLKYIGLGAVHKKRLHKIAKKLTPVPPLSEKYPLWLNPLSTFPCRHTINFEKFNVFFTNKCRRPHLRNPILPCPKNVRSGQTPSPLTAGSFTRKYAWVDHVFAKKYLCFRVQNTGIIPVPPS